MEQLPNDPRAGKGLSWVENAEKTRGFLSNPTSPFALFADRRRAMSKDKSSQGIVLNSPFARARLDWSQIDSIGAEAPGYAGSIGRTQRGPSRQATGGRRHVGSTFGNSRSRH